MRKVLIFCVLIFIILIVFPITIYFVSNQRVIINSNKPQQPTFSGTSSDEQSHAKDAEIELAMSMCSETFCDEGLKAVLSIAKNNYRLNNSNININTEHSEKLYQRINKIYSKTDAQLTYKGTAVYLPTSSLSTGHTKTDDKYPYIKPVASPWDCYSEEYIYKKEYSEGISLWGLNYLCEEGLSYKEALSWYLPDFDIK